MTATNSEGPQQALDWVLAFGNQMPPPPPSQQQPLPYGYPPQPQSQPQSQPYGGAAGYGSYPPRVQQQQHGPAYPVAPTAAGGGGGGHYPSVPGAGGSYAPGYGLPYGVPSQPQLQPTAATRPASGAAAPSSVGVAGIVRREEAKVTATGQSLSAAFSDLSALMQMAADMVKLAERFRGVATGQQAAAAAAGGAAPGDDLLMDAETQLELISMGIASPVTKESAGARYHVELSRQLADFLAAPLAKAGGVMTVADVYCLFNRARGTELVSPDDLLQAISMFQSVGVPLRLRRFASGVTVVQSSLHSDAEMVRRISQLVAGGSAAPGGGAAADSCGPGITAADLSRAAGISLTIAREHLLSAEAGCVLCRDDGPEGLRFYRNFFTDSAVLSYLRQRQQQQQLRSV